jgi:hypothetical protein
MRVIIYSDDGDCLWQFERLAAQSAGFTSPEFLPEVVAALRIALIQAEGQLGRPLDEVDAVLDVGASAAEVDGDVPFPGIRHPNSSREMREVTAVVMEAPTGPVVAEISIVRKHDVATVRAIHNDNIARL